MNTMLSRRSLLATAALSSGYAACDAAGASGDRWQPTYILSSALYGDADLADILPQVAAAGCSSIDLWPKPHGTQREEIDRLGIDHVRQLMQQHRVRLGGLACYRPGAFQLASEFAVARALGDKETVLVTMAPGDGSLRGAALDQAIRDFLTKIEPSIRAAEAGGGVIAIENHANSLLKSPESIRRFVALVESEAIGIALAPHHLPQEGGLLADLAGEAGSGVKFVYAQQHGHGSSEKLPKQEELLQLPGRGPLDFGPLMRQLARQSFAGPIEIFMHPVPRGVPILPSIAAITEAILDSKRYLNGLVTD